ncbi:MAG: hypothetical protein ACR2P5_07270 [Gammaproteobacteria bacterium]
MPAAFRFFIIVSKFISAQANISQSCESRIHVSFHFAVRQNRAKAKI